MRLFKSTLMLVSVAISLLVIGCSKKQEEPVPYKWPIIDGFPKPQVPIDNPMSEAKVALGRAIFYDENLSFNQKQSCATCHLQENAFAEPLVTSIGTSGEVIKRNAPSLVNIAYNKTLTWAHDGITSIERQLLLPMFGESPIEMGITGHEDKVIERFKTPEYKALYQAAFPNIELDDTSFMFDATVKALASFVRSLISLNSPFDQYAYYGNDDAMSESAIRGMNLFFSEKFECHHCHGGFNFTQSTSHEKQLIDRRPFHNTGLYNTQRSDGSVGYPEKDLGLAEISTIAKDDGRFRAPTLRNIEVSAPYMHDGSIVTLAQVLDFYAAGGRNVTTGEYIGDGRENPLKSVFVKGFEMSEQDKADLIAFMNSLTDETFLRAAEHSDPRLNSH